MMDTDQSILQTFTTQLNRLWQVPLTFALALLMIIRQLGAALLQLLRPHTSRGAKRRAKGLSVRRAGPSRAELAVQDRKLRTDCGLGTGLHSRLLKTHNLSRLFSTARARGRGWRIGSDATLTSRCRCGIKCK